MRPQVTIIIPCFNQAQYLYEAVYTAMRSTENSLEIIIVDDGSSNDDVQSAVDSIIQQFTNRKCDIILIRQENRGLSAARNTGLRFAKGEFIQFLDADDLLVPKKIDEQISHFSMSGLLDVSISECLFSNEDLDTFNSERNMIFGFDYSLQDFAFSWERGLSIPIHCALFRKSVFFDIQFCESVRAKEDWVFWTNVAVRKKKIGYLGLIGAIYRVHQSSMCRGTSSIGRQWLRAATEIDAFVSPTYPEFLPKAVEWYAKHYVKNAIDKKVNESSSSISGNGSAYREKNWSDASVSPYKSQSYTGEFKPRISIVIPIFNHYDYLEQCIMSALNQTETSIQVILADDASTDLRVQALCRDILSSNPKVKYYRNDANLGIAENQNKAVAYADGQYIAFLDCDDIMAPNAIEIVLNAISTSDAAYIFSDFFEIDEADEVIRLARYGGYKEDRFSGDVYVDLVMGMVASHLKVIRKRELENVGSFDAKYSGVQDWALALNFARARKEFFYIPLPLYFHRKHKLSVTHSQARTQHRLGNVLRYEYLTLSECRWEAAARFVSLAAKYLSANVHLKRNDSGFFELTLTGKPLRDDIWFLREFSGFLVSAVVENVESYIALVGYIHNPENIILNNGG